MLVTIYILLLMFIKIESSMFFHEPSQIAIEPAGDVTSYTDFGFTLSYQNGRNRLVVGTPHGDSKGQVYSCQIEDILKKTPKCQKLNIDLNVFLAKSISSTDFNSDHNLCLGMSIISTPDYIMTCAPLWVTEIRSSKSIQDSFGTCLVYYNDSKVERYSGLVEQHKRHAFVTNPETMRGTIGINSLYDDTNKLILLANPTRLSDITYVQSLSPTSDTQSLHNLRVNPAENARTAYLNVHSDYLKRHGFNYQFSNINTGMALTAGRFFSDINATVYAFSLQDDNRHGKVAFLEYDEKENFLKMIFSDDSKPLSPTKVLEIVADPFEDYDVINTLFGVALASADLNTDGASELLIGAPAHSQDASGVEAGALFIHIGGLKSEFAGMKNRRVIYGEKDESRFGSTIAANDLDGDSIPEILVSAPFEDSEAGAIYILSGYELKHTLFLSEKRSLFLSQLMMTQVIKSKGFKSFGFSLQMIPDVDSNGCDELAVGSPKSAKVILFRCIPTVNVTLFGIKHTEEVKITDSNFTLKICVNVSHHLSSSQHISTKLSVVSRIKAGIDALIENTTFYVDLSTGGGPTYCEDLVVKLLNKDAGRYVVESTLDSNFEALVVGEEYKETWASLSPYSVTRFESVVFRQCSGNCSAVLSSEVLFGGRNNSEAYTLGFKANDTLEVKVRNDGASVLYACAHIRVAGADVTTTSCRRVEATDVFYECLLPAPFRRDEKALIKMLLKLPSSSRKKKNIRIETLLFEQCHFSEASEEIVEFSTALTGEHVSLYTPSTDVSVTDGIIRSEKSKVVEDNHEYIIKNNGTILWENTTAVVTMDRKEFLINVKVSTSQGQTCKNETSDVKFVFNCFVDISPESEAKIVVTIDILKDNLKKRFVNRKLEIKSDLVLQLDPVSETRSRSHVTTMHLEEKLGIKHDKNLIGIIAAVVAILVIAIIGCALYKSGFFKRKQKEQLENLKESVRKQSINPIDTPEVDETKNNDLDDNAIEVVEEFSFEVVSVAAMDNPAYDPREEMEDPSEPYVVRTEAQVH